MNAIRYTALGYEQIVADDLVDAVNLTPPVGADMALIRVEAASVRWRDDGTAPTADVGFLMTDTDAPFEYTSGLAVIQFIAESGSPILNISYYRTAG